MSTPSTVLSTFTDGCDSTSIYSVCAIRDINNWGQGDTGHGVLAGAHLAPFWAIQPADARNERRSNIRLDNNVS